MEHWGSWMQGFLIFLLVLDKLIAFIRGRTNSKSKSSNATDNPHATTEYVHNAIDKRTLEIKTDIKDLEKKVNKACVDIGVLMSRDPNLRSRAGDG